MLDYVDDNVKSFLRKVTSHYIFSLMKVLQKNHFLDHWNMALTIMARGIFLSMKIQAMLDYFKWQIYNKDVFSIVPNEDMKDFSSEFIKKPLANSMIHLIK